MSDEGSESENADNLYKKAVWKEN